jgi:hypothetical protein
MMKYTEITYITVRMYWTHVPLRHELYTNEEACNIHKVYNL